MMMTFPTQSSKPTTPQSVLSVDIGTINTRVCLFDIRAGKFRFVGSASDRTTHLDREKSEYVGVISAVRKLEKVVKKSLLDHSGNIITPSTGDFSGVDQVAVSYTCVADPAIAIYGLSQSGSLHSLRTLLDRIGITPVLECSADDGISCARQLDRLTATCPRMIVFAGGTANGARKAVYRIGETIMLYCKSLPMEQRPLLLFLGNRETQPEINRVFNKISDITYGANLLDPENDNESTLNSLLKVMLKDAMRRAPGFETLRERTGASFIPGEFAFGRSVRLLSRLIKRSHHVLGVNIGAKQTILVDAMDLQILPVTLPIGLGETLPRILEKTSAEEIQSEIDFQIKSSEIRDYILNKSLYPELVPANEYAAEIESALKLHLIKTALTEAKFRGLPVSGRLSTVLLTGSGLRNVEDPGNSLLTAMNALRPLGAVDYLLDMNGLASVIGAVMHANPELVTQLMDSSTYLNLGKVIRFDVQDEKLFKHSGPKQPTVVISLKNTLGEQRDYEIPFGGLVRIPLNYGFNYQLEWKKIPRGVATPGIKPYLPLGFKSGCFGLIFDMRDGRDVRKERTAQIERLRLEKEQLGNWRLGEGGVRQDD